MGRVVYMQPYPDLVKVERLFPIDKYKEENNKMIKARIS